MRELGLTYRQIGARVGRHKDGVANMMRLLQLSEEILELLERGQLSGAHGRALLAAKDPEARQELARAAIEQGWSTRELSARAHESNIDAGQARDPEQERDAEQARDPLAMNVAKVWGDLLGVEVGVRALGGRQLRVEAVFTSAEAALNVGGDLAEQVARAKKRRS